MELGARCIWCLKYLSHQIALLALASRVPHIIGIELQSCKRSQEVPYVERLSRGCVVIIADLGNEFEQVTSYVYYDSSTKPALISSATSSLAFLGFIARSLLHYDYASNLRCDHLGPCRAKLGLPFGQVCLKWQGSGVV